NVCRDTPTRTATSVTDAPANTARTASNRCSTTDNATSTNPDLPKPDAPPGHHAQVAEERPLSRVYWRRTANHLLPEGIAPLAATVRTFFTGIKRITGVSTAFGCGCVGRVRVRTGAV